MVRTSATIAALVAAFLGVPGVVPVSAQEATLADFAWLTGTWQGPGPEGALAEIQCMAPKAGELPAFFRLYQPDRVLILEAISLVGEEGGVFMNVRHFDTALTPLEMDHAIRLRLAERKGDTFVFENVRAGENPVRSVMVRTDGGFTSWSELARPDGSTDTLKVVYRKVSDRR